MKRKSLWLLALLATVSLCSGCWDNKEVERRAMVVGCGIDAAPKNKVKVTGQFFISETSPLNIGEKPTKPFITITSTARTAYNALPGLESKTTKSLFWGELESTVVGHKLAKRGLKQYLDFLERVPAIPPQGHIVLAEGTAHEILSVPLAAKFVPGIAIDDFLDSSSKADQIAPIKYWQFIRAINVGPTDPYLPIISYNKEEQLFYFKGLGVFRRDRLVGELDQNESRMTVFLMGKAKNANLLVFVPGMGEVALHGIAVKSGIKVLQVYPKIKMLISVKAHGLVGDIPSEAADLKDKDVKKLERAIVADLNNQMNATIRRLQTLDSDIIGFGEILRATRPESWGKIKWDKEYPLADIQVKVSFKAKEFGTYR